jgi:uncharacterized membrane protein YgaE (UPF0421/DUF939 family)
MKSKYVWKIFVAAWLGTAVAVIAGVYFTHSAWCMWALVLPVCMGTSSN